jgi:uncharacterized protein YdeI (YjbR/CyaY-like superfamily)
MICMAGRLDDRDRIEPGSREAWRAWLKAHHATSPGVWLVTFTKRSGRGGLDYEGTVLEALCFGWVDSTVRKLDDERTMQYVAPRRPGSTWARTNKARVERLIAAGLMEPAGLAVIERAKADGSWDLLTSVEALEMPPDLGAALDAADGAREGYEALPVSRRQLLLWSVVSAKRAETRAARIAAAVEELIRGR